MFPRRHKRGFIGTCTQYFRVTNGMYHQALAGEEKANLAHQVSNIVNVSMTKSVSHIKSTHRCHHLCLSIATRQTILPLVSQVLHFVRVQDEKATEVSVASANVARTERARTQEQAFIHHCCWLHYRPLHSYEYNSQLLACRHYTAAVPTLRFARKITILRTR